MGDSPRGGYVIVWRGPTPMNIFRATERLRERGPITIRPNQESQKAYSTEVHMGKQEHFIHGEDSARGGQEIVFIPLQEPAQTNIFEHTGTREEPITIAWQPKVSKYRHDRRARYNIRRSGLIDKVENNVHNDDLYGVYAARRYDSLEPITVYVGETIGKVRGEDDDNPTIAQGGGRHVLAIGPDLIDGTQGGFTAAHRINSACRVEGYSPLYG